MAQPAAVVLDQSSLRPFQPAAGHDGVMSGEDGEILVKPCTQAEADFYQETVEKHPYFCQFMPLFMGTLTLGSPATPAGAQLDTFVEDNTTINLPKAQGKKIAAETAIVLENLEHGFDRPCVIDLKLGARLHAPGTAPAKAARLDQVAAETTSGSLNFRVAGMKVWNPKTDTYDIYDKQYGRKFDKDTVVTAFLTYFDLLAHDETGRQVVETILAELRELHIALQAQEARFYSASVLIVFEGDSDSLYDRLAANDDSEDEEDEDEDEDYESDEQQESKTKDLNVFMLKMIDFAHSTWQPGQGPDDNVITGLLNIEDQISKMLTALRRR